MRAGLKADRRSPLQVAARAAWDGLLLGLFLSACMILGVLVLVQAGVL